MTLCAEAISHFHQVNIYLLTQNDFICTEVHETIYVTPVKGQTRQQCFQDLHILLSPSCLKCFISLCT